MRRIDAKRLQFQAQIRRRHIQHTFTHFRKASELDLTTPDDIARLMSLPSRLHAYTMLDLLLQKQKALLSPPLQEMQEEGPDAIPLDIHIRFWKLYSEHLFREQSKLNNDLRDTLLSLISIKHYEAIHRSTAYQLHLLNTLQLIAADLSPREKKKIIEWVAGPEGLRVIKVCISDQKLQFLRCQHYKRLYMVIEAGLKSELKAEGEEAAGVLGKLLQKADWDDTFQLYERFHGLMNYICLKIQRYQHDEPTHRFNRVALLLLDTYDEAVVDYARAGVAYTAALLITSPIEQNNIDGLEMLRMLTQIDDKRNISFLLDSSDIESTGVWRRLCREDVFGTHGNRMVREHYQAVIHHILAVGDQEQIEQLCRKFSDRYQDIFEMFVEGIDRNESEAGIVVFILQSMVSLVYYGRENGKPHLLEQIFEQRGLISILEKLSQKEGDLATSAKNVLDNLYYVYNG